MASTFRGGVHPDSHKSETAHKALESAPVPQFLIFPLSQHVGAPAVSLVAVGDTVLVGQKIAEPGGHVSASVHSSVSGTVIAIEPRTHPTGGQIMSIVVENDFADRVDTTIAPRGTVASLTPEEIVDAALEAGIVGLGGAAFPTHVKLRPAEPVTELIVNCAECEPYITSGFRAMVEHTAEIIGGIRLAMKATKAPRAIIAIENNKFEAVTAFEKMLPPDGDIRVKVVKTKYPQGGEKQLIKAVTGREVPPGKLPAAVGCVVFNPETLLALYRAVLDGAPLITRSVTVSGSAIANPKNLLVRVGTPIGDIIDVVGGFKSDPVKVVVGGPMMGNAQSTLDVPVVKATNAVLVFAEGDAPTLDGDDCIRCGRCVEVCPVNLVPVYIALLYRQDMIEQLEKYHPTDCIECGACAFICPARIPLAQIIRTAKTRFVDSTRGAR